MRKGRPLQSRMENEKASILMVTGALTIIFLVLSATVTASIAPATRMVNRAERLGKQLSTGTIREGPVLSRSPSAPVEEWNLTLISNNPTCQSSPAVADVDGDNRLEVIACGASQPGVQGNVCCVTGMGKLKWFYSTPSHVYSSPAIADLDGDGKLEIVVVCETSTVYCFDGTGGIEWTQDLGAAAYTYSSPAVADVDGDGELEIVLYVNYWLGSANQFDGIIYCLGGRGGIEWTYTMYEYLSESLSSSAIADVDADGQLEIIVGAIDGNVYCLSGTGGKEWNSTIGRAGHTYYSSPTISDINNDGDLEIIVGLTEDDQVCCLTNSGHKEWNYTTGGTTISSPVVADADGDGKMEIVIWSYGSDYSDRVYCLDATGRLEWLHIQDNIVGCVAAIADIDGDNEPEILVGPDCLNGGGGSEWVYTPPFPIMCLYCSTTVADIDGDGQLEALVCLEDGKIHCLSVVSAPLDPNAYPWPSIGYQGDIRHTGCFTDTDSDNLTDCYEVTAGTNPRSIDTDGDGLTDYEEFLGSSNPLGLVQPSPWGDTDEDGVPNYIDVTQLSVTKLMSSKSIDMNVFGVKIGEIKWPLSIYVITPSTDQDSMLQVLGGWGMDYDDNIKYSLFTPLILDISDVGSLLDWLSTILPSGLIDEAMGLVCADGHLRIMITPMVKYVPPNFQNYVELFKAFKELALGNARALDTTSEILQELFAFDVAVYLIRDRTTTGSVEAIKAFSLAEIVEAYSNLVGLIGDTLEAVTEIIGGAAVFSLALKAFNFFVDYVVDWLPISTGLQDLMHNIKVILSAKDPPEMRLSLQVYNETGSLVLGSDPLTSVNSTFSDKYGFYFGDPDKQILLIPKEAFPVNLTISCTSTGQDPNGSVLGYWLLTRDPTYHQTVVCGGFLGVGEKVSTTITIGAGNTYQLQYLKVSCHLVQNKDLVVGEEADLDISVTDNADNPTNASTVKIAVDDMNITAESTSSGNYLAKISTATLLGTHVMYAWASKHGYLQGMSTSLIRVIPASEQGASIMLVVGVGILAATGASITFVLLYRKKKAESSRAGARN